MQVNNFKPYLFMSGAICLLVIICCLTGITSQAVYETESFNWQVQAVWQDYINLALITPILSVSAWLVNRGSHSAKLVWAGSLLYLAYTYTIYCFDIHFNYLFFFYCLILGLSFYALTWFFFQEFRFPIFFPGSSSMLSKITGIYLLLLGSGFYLLWLFEILPSIIKHSVPASLLKEQLFTNPVHVLDLSLLLPGFILAGVLLIRKKPMGSFLGGILLVFAALMSLTIAGLQILLIIKGFASTPILAVIMLALAIIDLVLFIILPLEPAK